MSIAGALAVATALIPFVAVAGLLWLARTLRARREAAIVRQIALTDAIHRELGAAAAPEVRRSWTRGWIVSVALPLHREGLVGAVGRITHDVFARLDGSGGSRLRLVLIPRALPRSPRARLAGSARAARRLDQAA
jgi:hypothetical protein